MQRGLRFQSLFNDRHQHITANGGPYLSLHRVGAVAHESLDPQILLNPIKEKLDLPATFVQLRYLQRLQLKVIGQEYQLTVVLLIEEFDPAQYRRIASSGESARQQDVLISQYSDCLIERTGLNDPIMHFVFRADDEKWRRIGKPDQACKVYVAPCPSRKSYPLAGADHPESSRPEQAHP